MTTEMHIGKAEARAYRIPTDAPEADGTFRWDSTTMNLVALHAGGVSGIGWSYGHAATTFVIRALLEKCVSGRSAMDLPALHQALLQQVRNDGSRGIAAMAIAAIDIALWDLKAKLLGQAVSSLIGKVREGAPVYGSGGFTSYSDAQLEQQFAGWAKQGIRSMKMKIGTDVAADPHRIAIARTAIGDACELMMDANGAFSSASEASAFAHRISEHRVVWFEEPVSSDDLAGLAYMRAHAPLGMEIAAGEYCYDHFYTRRMIASGAVDVMQLDATRCHGFTGFLQCAAVAQSFNMPVSAHCAPSLHMHVTSSIPDFRHIEYFHDHARIEEMLFDGFIAPRNGVLVPDTTRAGMGLEFKRKDAEKFLLAV